MPANFISSGKSGRDPRFLVASIVVAILAIAAFRSAFSAYFLLDDFGMLAIARFLGNPLDPFVHDIFPGGLYYRPLGMLLWWLSERAFGAMPFAHYCLNLLLHGFVALALGSLVSQLCGNRWVGLFAAACFVLHPIGIGTTLWLSDRFDLLALLFGLLALHAALQFSRDNSRRSLWATLILLSLSLLSKEIALACFAGAGVLWLAATDGRSLSRRIRHCLYLLLPAITYLVVRTLILDRVNAQPLFPSGNLATLFIDGMLNWLSGWMDYLLFWSRLDSWKRILSIGSMILLAVTLIASMGLTWSASRRQALLVGMAIWLSSGLLQWPLLSHFSVGLSDSGSAVDTVLNARHFYTSLAGFLISIAALATPLLTHDSWRRWWVLAALALLAPWFAASQSLARAHRIGTEQVEALVSQANATIGKLDVPSRGCQIYLLDTDVWNFGWVSDEAIKATVPNLQRIAHCLIQTEHTPWYHIAKLDPLERKNLRPMTLIEGAARRTAIRPLGKATYLILNLDAASKVPTDSSARFLSWQGSGFFDVTDDVLNGHRKPAFICNRPESECPR